MNTFQDLLKLREANGNIAEFIEKAISEHEASSSYLIAMDAENYIRQKNTTIFAYKKLLYTLSGKAVPDNYSANHKCASNFFKRIVVQQNQYILGNGAILDNDEEKKKLGKRFDERLQKAGKCALVQGAAFIFWNYDHIEVFRYTEFVPLWDEKTGKLRAGIRYWQIDEQKPVVAILYEEDGFTEYEKEKGSQFKETIAKTTYKIIKVSSPADGERIEPGGNYAGFPIVPLWGCPEHQSALVGLKENIDCYDLIKSGFANDLDDASMIYWTINNAGGMDDLDLVKFVERMKTVKAAVVQDDGARAEEHTIEVPSQSRETYLTRLSTDIYKDAMALDTDKLSAGNVTATAIRTAYQALDDKCDEYEYCLLDCLYALFEIAGVNTDSITFKRNRIANYAEDTMMIMSAQMVLDDETILNHLPFLSPDEIKDVLKRKDKEEMEKIEIGTDEDDDTNPEEEDDDADGEKPKDGAKKE